MIVFIYLQKHQSEITFTFATCGGTLCPGGLLGFGRLGLVLRPVDFRLLFDDRKAGGRAQGRRVRTGIFVIDLDDGSTYRRCWVLQRLMELLIDGLGDHVFHVLENEAALDGGQDGRRSRFTRDRRRDHAPRFHWTSAKSIVYLDDETFSRIWALPVEVATIFTRRRFKGRNLEYHIWWRIVCFHVRFGFGLVRFSDHRIAWTRPRQQLSTNFN